MRPLPIAFVVLLLALVVGLGLRAVLQTPTGGLPKPVSIGGAASPRELGGLPQGHVYTGCSEEPDDVNPFTANSNAARRMVLAYTHEALLDLDPRTGGLRPALAETYEPAADGRSCVFTLRSGVCFADGAPVTMDDVLFGYELHQAGKLSLGFVGSAFARVERVEVLDERRFRVHFRGLHYASVRIVGEVWVVAQKRFFVDAVRRQLDPGEAMPELASERFAQLLGRVDRECGPGTGPYVLHNPPDGSGTWRVRQDVLLTRNGHCWRRTVAPGCWNFAGIRALWRDPAAATNSLLLRELDWLPVSDPEALLAQNPQLAADYQPMTVDYDSLGVFRCVWNCELPPFDDVRVRRAVGMLFDREHIAKILGPGARPAVAHAKPGRAEYPALLPLAFDVAAARRLLREAGYDPAAGKPLRMVLVALQGTEALRRMVESFAAAAKSAGVELDLRARGDMPGFVAEKRLRQWHGVLAYQSFRPWGDPYDLLASDGSDNESGWKNEAADGLARAARLELDGAKRAQLWRELHTLVHEQQPMALLAHPVASILLAKRVRGVEPGPCGLIPDRGWVALEQQRQ